MSNVKIEETHPEDKIVLPEHDLNITCDQVLAEYLVSNSIDNALRKEMKRILMQKMKHPTYRDIEGGDSATAHPMMTADAASMRSASIISGKIDRDAVVAEALVSLAVDSAIKIVEEKASRDPTAIYRTLEGDVLRKQGIRRLPRPSVAYQHKH